MFEDRTYEDILAEALDNAPPGIDTRQGSIFFDAVAGVCFKLAQYYADLKHAFELVFLGTAVGEYLDRKGQEFGVPRNPAVPARYRLAYEGTAPSPGARFFAEGAYFVTVAQGGALYLEAEESGLAGNSVIAGTSAVPMDNITGLTASRFGALAEPGVEQESDDEYRNRVWGRISRPAENGNRRHYKAWCEQDPGVGRARILPLFAGANTVLGVLTGTDGTPAAPSVVNRVQSFVDPASKGRTVTVSGVTYPSGDGLGDGAANIGAHFTAAAATPKPVRVSVTAVLSPGATAEQAAKEATEAVRAHLRDIALSAPENKSAAVSISTVGAILHALPSVRDYVYTSLLFNGRPESVALADTEIPVLEGEVIVNAAV